MKVFVFLSIVSFMLCRGVSCQTTTYDFKSVEADEDRACPTTAQEMRESIHQDVLSFINDTIISI